MSASSYIFEYERTLPDGGMRTDLFEFNVPVRPPTSDSQAFEVEILKLYFGLISKPGETATANQFDTRLQVRISQWQAEHRTSLEEETTVWNRDTARRVDIIPEIRINEPFKENGTVGEITFRAMMRRGLGRAAKEFLESRYYNDYINNLERAQEPFGENVLVDEYGNTTVFPGENDDVQKPPKVGKEYITYKYVSKYTIKDFASIEDFYKEENISTLKTIFRKSVLAVFRFYKKDLAWTITGENPQKDEYEKLLKAHGALEGVSIQPLERYNFVVTAANDPNSAADRIEGGFEDVLRRQSLSQNLTKDKIYFAHIKEISPPSLRPLSVYNFVIRIKKSMFNEISGGNDALQSNEFDLDDENSLKRLGKAYDDAKEKAEEVWNTAKGAYDAAGDLVDDFKNLSASKVRDQIDKGAKAAKRKIKKEAAKIAKNAWSQALEGRGELDEDFQRNAALEHIENSQFVRAQNLSPPILHITMNEFKGTVKRVAGKIRDLEDDIRTFVEENSKPGKTTSRFERIDPPIVPSISPETIASDLESVIEPMDEYMQLNYNATLPFREGPERWLKDTKLRITFTKVSGYVNNSISSDPAVQSSAAGNVTTTNVKTIVGYKVQSISLTNAKKGLDKPLLVGLDVFNRSQNTPGRRPFTNPTTMGYLSLLPTLDEDLRENPCSDLDEGKPALVFFSRYHWPTLSINFNKQQQSGINIDATINERVHSGRGIYTASLKSVSEIKNKAILSLQQEKKELKALKNKIADSKIEDVIKFKGTLMPELPARWPTIRDLPCDLKQMWSDFINQFDMNMLICDLWKCVPSLNLNWNFNFNWSIPSLPDIPSFDPLVFILPRLKIAINDIILSFICEFIGNILKTVNMPDCTDVLRAGVALYSAIDARDEGNPFANAPEKASTAEKVSETLDNMGLTDYTIGDDETNLLESVSVVLSPTEFCQLLQGKATDDVLNIVLKIIKATPNSLKEVLDNIEDVNKFFTTLGTVVDPMICDRIQELSDIVISQELCENDEDLRRMLQDAGANDDQIRSELQALNDKRKILKDLAESGDLSKLLPEFTADQLKDAGLPGPYDNEYHDKIMKRAIATILTAFKSYLQLEIAAFPQTILDEFSMLPEPGDSAFNEVDYLRFRWYTKQIEYLGRPDNNPLLPKIPPKKIQKFATKGMGLEAMAVYQEIEIPSEHWNKLTMYPVAGAEYNFEGPDQETFNNDIERFVTRYLETYTQFSYAVSDVLRKLLVDAATITRKYPNYAHGGARELSVAILTTAQGLESIPYDLTLETEQSADNVIGVVDLPFQGGEDIKDCYRVSYNVPQGEEVVTRVFSNTIPDPYVEMRASDIDITSNIHSDKLLRPGAFASFLINKYRNLLPAGRNIGRNTFDVYSDGDNIIPKIQGYVTGPDMARIQQLAEQGEDAGSLEEALAQYRLKVSQIPLYSSVSDSLNYQISEMIKKSKYFEVENVEDLKVSLTQEHTVGEDGCLKKSDKIIDLEPILDKFMENFKQKISEPKHDPTTRDFSKKGPYEEVMVETLFKLYIDMSCLEILLKNIFMLSEIGAKNILSDKIVLDYVAEYVTSEMSNLLGGQLNRKLHKVLRTMTGMEDPKAAIRSIVLKNVDFKTLTDFVYQIYEPRHKSFKEVVYNDMSNNIKDYPSKSDYPKVTVLKNSENDLDEQTTAQILAGYLNRSGEEGLAGRYAQGDLTVSESELFLDYLNNQGFVDIPVSGRLPNLYDRFRFKGYSEELIQKKINSGHFWIEKFYKIENFSEFKRTYNEIYQICSNDPYIGRIIPLSDDYEYMSSEDLEGILFGYESTETYNEIQNTLEEGFQKQQLEYDYIKTVYLALLSDFFINRANLPNAIAFKIMEDLGMADVTSFNPERTPQDKFVVYDLERYGGRQIQVHWIFNPIVANARRLEEAIRQRNSEIESVRARNAAQRRIDREADVPPPLTDQEKLAILYDGIDVDTDGMSMLSPDSFDAPPIEIDLAYRRGSVTKEQLYERMKLRLRQLLQLTPFRATETPWDRFSPVYRIDPSFGNRAGDYGWIETIDALMPNSDQIGIGRKAEIVVDCLTKFVELAHNWPSDSEIPAIGDTQVWRPLWRDTNSVANSGFSPYKAEVLRSASSAQLPAISYDMPTPDGIGGYIVSLALQGQLEPGDELVESMMYNHFKPNSDLGTSKYHTENRRQNEILEWYIQEIFRVDTPIDLSTTRAGIFNIGSDIDPSRVTFDVFFDDAGRETRSIIPVREVDGAAIAEKQLELYTHLKDNLHVGYRMMFGHAVKRRETDLYGTAENYIRPDDIFGDFNVTNKGQMGVSNERQGINMVGAFSSKATFLGHVEKNPVSLVSGRDNGFNSLNEQSIFYNNARLTIEKHNTEFVLGRQVADGGFDINLMSDDIVEGLVYCIPVDEITRRVDCFEDIFSEFEEIEKRPTLEKITQMQEQIESISRSDDQTIIDRARAVNNDLIERRNVLMDSVEIERRQYESAMAEFNENPTIVLRYRSPITGRMTYEREVPRPRPSDARIQQMLREIRGLESLIESGNEQIAQAERGELNLEETDILLAPIQARLGEEQKIYNTQGFYNVFETEAERQRGKISHIRRSFLKKGILFEKYHEDMISQILSLGPEYAAIMSPVIGSVPYTEEKTGGLREIDNENIDSTEEQLKPHRILFDYLFPLDRYASLHFLHNLEVYDNNRGRESQLLKATKLFIIQTLLQMQGLASPEEEEEITETGNSTNVLRDNAGSFTLPTPDEIMEMIWNMIKKAAQEAAVAAYRGIADAVDFGYRDMRRGYQKDPCSMAAGLTHKLMRYGLADIDGTLEDGFGSKNGCKYYVPINKMGNDLVRALLNVEPSDIARDTYKISQHLKGTMQPGNRKRYGYLLTPIGWKAAGLPENKGEKHSKLKKDNGCEEGCETKEVVEQRGKCEDQEGQQTQPNQEVTTDE